MADFDPYHIWLGIPPQHQPADHYRLLGIERFESDPSVIASAADRQMAHVRTFQSGKNGAASQRVLNHLAQARNCLLNEPQKAAYDQALRQQMPVIPPGLPQPPGIPDPPMAIPTSPHAFPYPAQGMPFPPHAMGYPPPQGPFPMAIPAPLGAGGAYDPLAVPSPMVTPSASRRHESTLNPLVIAGIAVGSIALIGVVSLLVWNASGSKDDTQVSKASDTSNSTLAQALPDSPPPPESTSPAEPGETTTDTPPHTPEPGNTQPTPNEPTPGDTTANGVAPTETTTEASASPMPSQSAQATDAPLPSGPTVSVLKTITSPLVQTGGATVGTWQLVNGELRGKNGGALLPVNLPADYQLDIQINQIDPGAHLVVGLPIAGRPASLLLNWDVYGTLVSGLNPLDGVGADKNETSYKGRLFEAGKPSHVRCIVRGSSLEVVVDEKPIIKWHGDPTRYNVSLYWRHVGEDGLSLALGNGEARIASIEMTPLEPLPIPTRPDAPFVLAPARKFEAPSKNELQQARLAVRKGFEKEYAAAKAARTRRELAKTLFERAQEEKDPLSLRLGFWTEAQAVAADNFDANLACKAIEEVAKYFDVDSLAARIKVLEDMAKDVTPGTTIGELQNFAEVTCVTLDEVTAAERFDLAKRLGVIVKAFSLHKRFFERRAFFTKRLSDIETASQLYEAAQTSANASTPEEKYALGRYQCFIQGNWTKGLPLLAESSDAPLAEIAKRELDIIAHPDDAKYAQLGDLWWEISKSAGSPWDDEYRRQAGYWYEHVASQVLNQQFHERLKEVRGRPKNRYRPGLVGTYFGYDEKGILRLARIDKNISRGWMNGSPDASIGPDDFTVVWRGTIQAPIPGKYVISVNSDDGARLFLDGKKLFDDLGAGAGTRGAEVQLTGEPQQIEVAFHEIAGNAHCFLMGRFADESADRVIDGRLLRHDPVAARRYHATEFVGSYPETTRVPSVPEGGLLAIFEDQKELLSVLTEDMGLAELDPIDRYSGEASVRVGTPQRFGTDSMGIRAKIRENPGTGEYRFVRFAWKKLGGGDIGIQFHGTSSTGDRDWRRYHTGSNKNEFPMGGGKSIGLADEGPAEWTVVTRDLFSDYGEFDLDGLAIGPFDRGYAKFDHIYLGRMMHDFEKLGELAKPENATEDAKK